MYCSKLYKRYTGGCSFSTGKAAEADYYEMCIRDSFMSLVKSGQIANCCHPNALLTLREYLDDYAKEDTKKLEMCIRDSTGGAGIKAKAFWILSLTPKLSCQYAEGSGNREVDKKFLFSKAQRDGGCPNSTQ